MGFSHNPIIYIINDYYHKNLIWLQYQDRVNNLKMIDKRTNLKGSFGLLNRILLLEFPELDKTSRSMYNSLKVKYKMKVVLKNDLNCGILRQIKVSLYVYQSISRHHECFDRDEP